MKVVGFRTGIKIPVSNPVPSPINDEDFEELNRYRMTDEQEASIEELRNLNAG